MDSKRLFTGLLLATLFLSGCAKTGSDTTTEADETRNLFLAVEHGDDGQTVDYYGAVASGANASFAAKGGEEELNDAGEAKDWRRRPRMEKRSCQLPPGKFAGFAKRIADENKGVVSVVGFGLRNPLEGEGDQEEDTILHSCKVDLTIVSNYNVEIEKEPSDLVALGASTVSEDKHTITISRAKVKRTRMVFSVRKPKDVDAAPTVKLSGVIDCGDFQQAVDYDLTSKIGPEKEKKFRFSQEIGDALLRGIGANFPPRPQDEDEGLYGDE